MSELLSAAPQIANTVDARGSACPGPLLEAKKAIGDTICLVGGLDVDLLGYGTPDECVAQAKAVIDACAPGGGFILGGGKALLSPNDARPENLHAVTKFVKEYGVYHA